jgi:phosphatidate cytidylyltransferase
MLGKRILSAAILIPVVLGVIYYGGWALFACVLLVALLATYEYAHLVRQEGTPPALLAALVLVALLTSDAQWPSLGLIYWVITFGPLFLLTVQVFRGNAPGSLATWALTVAGSLYIGYSLSYVIRLRSMDPRGFWVMLALVGTWICDSGAYFVGVRWGRRRFFPAISPKKSWEGALGGLVSGVLSVMLLARWIFGLDLLRGMLLGVLLVLGATFGDLAESVIKRQVGVKDSSQLIPGHGGMLDRVDSLLFVLPIVYMFLAVMRIAP